MKQKTFSHKSGAVLTLVLVLLFCSTLQAQTYTDINAYGYKWNRGYFKEAFRGPIGTVPVFRSNGDSTGAIFYNTSDSMYYYNTGYQWFPLGGGTGANNYPTSISFSSNTLTLARSGLSSLTASIDTATIFSTKYNVANSLNNYYTKSQINSFISGSTPISGYNKTNWDNNYASWSAAQALGGWALQTALVDTAAAIRASITTGSVTQAQLDDTAAAIRGDFPTGGVWGGITGTLSDQTDLQTALNAKQASLSGTGIVKSTGGTISYLTDNSTNWNTAYNDKINSGSYSSGTITLTQQDAGTVTITGIPQGTLTSESDPTVDAIIKAMPITADATTNKYYYWNNGSIGRKQIAYSDLSGTPDLSGYELLANKATDFSVVNNTKYPSTQAVADYVGANQKRFGVTGEDELATNWRYFDFNDYGPYFDNITDWQVHFSNGSNWVWSPNHSYFQVVGPSGVNVYHDHIVNPTESYHQIGSGNRSDLFIGRKPGSNSGYVWMDVQTGSSVDGYIIDSSGILLKPYQGLIRIDSLNTASTGDTTLMTWNPTNGRWRYKNISDLGFATTGDLSGYQPLDGDLTAISALSGTNTIYYRSAADTWSPVTIGSNLTFSGGTLSATGGGYTNLTEFVSQGNWKVFYSNGSGDVQELSLGAANTFLMSNGATSAPSFGSIPTQMSITSDASGLKLVGDVTSPGNSKYYGTDASGVRGFYDNLTATNWGGYFSNVNTQNGTSLTVSNTYQMYAFNGSSAANWTMPARAGGKVFWFKNAGSANLTLTRAGSDEFYTSTNVTSITVTPGNAVQIISAANYWYVFPYEDGTGGGSYTDEEAQDAVGAMINSTLTYTDATPLLGLNLSNSNIWTAPITANSFTVQNSSINQAILGRSIDTNDSTFGYLALKPATDMASKSAGTDGMLYILDDKMLYYYHPDVGEIAFGGGGGGDVVGPSSVSNNSVAVFDGATGKLLKANGYLTWDDNELWVRKNSGSYVAKFESLSGSGDINLKAPFGQAARTIFSIAGTDVWVYGAYNRAGGSSIDFEFYNSQTGVFPFFIDGNTDNVGIGNNTTPSEKLHVSGNIQLSGFIKANEITTPSTPAPGTALIYPKSDGNWYGLDDGGIETLLGGGGSSTFASLTDVNLTSLATNDFLKWDGTDWINRTPTNVRTDLGLVIGTNVQAYDADLTTYAGITPSANVQTLLGAADFAAFKTSLSLNNVDNTSDATKNSATATLTNKRITARTGTTTSSATPTINTDNVDAYYITAQTVDITSMTTNLSGTPTEGQKLLISITGTASRAITWGASFEASSIALPTTTSGTSRLDVYFIWNTVTSKWRITGWY